VIAQVRDVVLILTALAAFAILTAAEAHADHAYTIVTYSETVTTYAALTRPQLEAVARLIEAVKYDPGHYEWIPLDGGTWLLIAPEYHPH
jgi:hypothetical protein